MRVLIVGGGMAGLVLARGIAAPRGRRRDRRAGVAPTGRIPGPIMLPFQAYDALEEIGVLAPLRAEGIDIPPARNGQPVSISVRPPDGRRDPPRGPRDPLGARAGGPPARRRPGGRSPPADPGGRARRARRPGGRRRRHGLAGARAGRHPRRPAGGRHRLRVVPQPGPRARALLDRLPLGRPPGDAARLGRAAAPAAGRSTASPGGAEEALAPGIDAFRDGLPAPAAPGRGGRSRRSPTTTSPTARSRRCAARSGGARASPWSASPSTR